jgi:hypothetical protein
MRYLIILFSTYLFGLSTIQKDNLHIAYDVGKMIQAKDGTTFEIALATIMLNETSGGLEVIGDKYQDIYYFLHNSHEIIIDKTSEKYIEYGGYQKKVRIHKGKLKPLEKCSLGKFQVKLSTAKMLIRKYDRLKKYRKFLNNDKKLINMLLLYDYISAEIACHYLKNRYELALKKRLSNPYMRAISAYNGGWNNIKYKKKFLKNKKLVLELIPEWSREK